MTDIETRDSELHWDVYVTPGIPVETLDLPPGRQQRMWSPISATLISGERDAVLVDAFITVEQARARLVATPEVVKMMRQQASPQYLASFWTPRFPGQLADQLVLAEELSGNVIDLEGHDLVVVPLGHTDTDNTTCLHVPSIDLVVAGDAAYNDVHLHLGESNPQTRREWITALDTIEALHPRAVIAGHKRPGTDDDPRIIEETRQYIRDFDRVAQTTTARELYDQVLSLYPQRVNPGALWSSARALKP